MLKAVFGECERLRWGKDDKVHPKKMRWANCPGQTNAEKGTTTMSNHIRKPESSAQGGFTLIELSIVLVIIGLIVGGVLVGQDLIRAAEVRATVAQIEKYNTAVNTFRGKYNALPGDINAATASAFGFAARGGNPGQGDGNGVVEGYNGTTNIGYSQGGETLFFWVDLSVGNPASSMNINLIDGSYTTYATPATAAPAITAATAANYFPPAKLGRGNSVYAYSTNGINYYGIAPITTTVTTGAVASTPSMTVQQAYQIDKKTDDGLPATGSVTATVGTATTENAAQPTVNGVATGSLASTSCYDSTLNVYALGTVTNGGNGANCSLSFRFQ